MTATVTGKLSTSSGFTSYFPYPTGFTYLNCTVTNVAVAYSVDSLSTWRSGLGLQAASRPERLFVDNNANGIRVYNDNSALYGADFKVFLVKN